MLFQRNFVIAMAYYLTVLIFPVLLCLSQTGILTFFHLMRCYRFSGEMALHRLCFLWKAQSLRRTLIWCSLENCSWRCSRYLQEADPLPSWQQAYHFFCEYLTACFSSWCWEALRWTDECYEAIQKSAPTRRSKWIQGSLDRESFYRTLHFERSLILQWILSALFTVDWYPCCRYRSYGTILQQQQDSYFERLAKNINGASTSWCHVPSCKPRWSRWGPHSL